MKSMRDVPFVGDILNMFSKGEIPEVLSTLEITTIFPCGIACQDLSAGQVKSAYTGKHRLTFDEFRQILAKIPGGQAETFRVLRTIPEP